MSCSSEFIYQGPNVKGHGGFNKQVLKIFKLKMEHLLKGEKLNYTTFKRNQKRRSS